MSFKGETKEQEMDARNQIDAKSQKTAIGLYDKKVARVKEARECSADPFWIAGMKSRSLRRDTAYKSLKTFLEGKPSDLQTTADLKEFNGFVKTLKDSINDVEEHTRDQKAAVEELQEFLRNYEDATLFFDDFTETADFDLRTGAIKMVKIKR